MFCLCCKRLEIYCFMVSYLASTPSATVVFLALSNMVPPVQHSVTEGSGGKLSTCGMQVDVTHRVVDIVCRSNSRESCAPPCAICGWGCIQSTVGNRSHIDRLLSTVLRRLMINPSGWGRNHCVIFHDSTAVADAFIDCLPAPLNTALP